MLLIFLHAILIPALPLVTFIVMGISNETPAVTTNTVYKREYKWRIRNKHSSSDLGGNSTGLGVKQRHLEGKHRGQPGRTFIGSKAHDRREGLIQRLSTTQQGATALSRGLRASAGGRL